MTLPTPPLRTPRVQRDTRAWQLQVWISFAVAAVLCGSGLAWLPGTEVDRAFMVMGYAFCTSAAFALAKFVRDRQEGRADTPMFGAVVWGGFAAAMALTGWGLWRMGLPPAFKAFLLVSWLFLISSVFTLAKTLRDRHEADRLEAALGDADAGPGVVREATAEPRGDAPRQAPRDEADGRSARTLAAANRVAA